MKEKKIKRIKMVSTVLLYTILILFISSYFDLEVSTNELLLKLREKTLFAVLFGAFIAFFQEWILRKGQVDRSKEDDYS
ncbi:MAG: hypothetical protein GVY26_09205 [Bacteroidetes bacterium]|jgi:hypothetical protein|nr:hypothetical protein [Bacteroidota bacterium]